MRRNLATRMLCEAAVMVAAAQLLGYLKLFRLPQGGSVSLVMLPIFIFALRWGAAPGLMAGLVLGILQFVLDPGGVVGWQAILGDYILPYTLLGAAGLFRGRERGFVPGVLFGTLLRFLCHFTTGVTIWAEWMPPEFFGLQMTSVYLYSLLYNGSYIFLQAAAILVIAGVLKKRLRPYLMGEDLR